MTEGCFVEMLISDPDVFFLLIIYLFLIQVSRYIKHL